ncbi:MAG: non-heme iron oxygenase ferredoxin subunit [Burkholderiales bacterium]
MSDWTRVGHAADIAPGEHRLVDVDGTQIAIFNLDGEFFAIEDVCTHDGGELAGGAVEGDVVICPRHGARFCIRTGEALSPPAYEPTPKFPVISEDGVVLVRDDRWD